MEKIILVLYINVGNLDDTDIPKYMSEVSKQLSNNNDVLHYFIPIRDSETRIECLNPRFCDENDYKQIKELINKNNELINKLLYAKT